MASAKDSKKKLEQAAAKDESTADSLNAFLKEMNREKPGEVSRLGDTTNFAVDSVPTGAISLDLAIGSGGFPRGRIIELYGPESSGKTTLALAVAKNVQAMGGNVGFVDAEHALNEELCHNIGIDFDKFIVNQPNSGEAGIEMVKKMIKSKAFDMIIVDSVAAMVPMAELEADETQQSMGLHARLMSRFMRNIAGPVAESGVMLVLVNQIRKNLGAYGTPDTTTGGSAIKFFASLRIEVRSASSQKIVKNGDVIGITVKATVKKNKVGAPFREAEYDLIFGHGIDGTASIIDACESVGVLLRSGGSYTEAATGEKLVVGKENLKAMLKDDPAMQQRLTDAFYAKLKANSVPLEEGTGLVSDDELEITEQNLDLDQE